MQISLQKIINQKQSFLPHDDMHSVDMLSQDVHTKRYGNIPAEASRLFDAECPRNGTRNIHSYNEIKGTYTRPTQGCHFELPWVTLSDLVKYSMTPSIARSLCDSWASRQRQIINGGHYCPRKPLGKWNCLHQTLVYEDDRLFAPHLQARHHQTGGPGSEPTGVRAFTLGQSPLGLNPLKITLNRSPGVRLDPTQVWWQFISVHQVAEPRHLR